MKLRTNMNYINLFVYKDGPWMCHIMVNCKKIKLKLKYRFKTLKCGGHKNKFKIILKIYKKLFYIMFNVRN